MADTPMVEWNDMKRTSTKPSQRAKPRAAKLVHIEGIPELTDEMRAELVALEALGDEDIDFSDIPERSETAEPLYVGLFYRGPGKKSVTIRLDADMVNWFKAQGKGWQTKMNWALRLYYASHRKTGAQIGKP